MDPISAFALAGTVITFVEFSGKLLSGAVELYTASSGTISANDELELVTSDLQVVITKIQTFEETANDAATSTSEDGQFGDSFVAMCEEANSIASTLLGNLDRLKLDKDLKGARRVRKSLSQAVKSAWARSEIVSLEERLQKLRELIEFRVLFSLRQSFNVLSLQQSQAFAKLDQQTQQIFSALSQGTARQANDTLEQTTVLTKLLARMEIKNSEEHHKTRELVADRAGCSDILSTSDVLDTPERKERHLRKHVGNLILMDLRFETMAHRFEEVAEAHLKTLDWIYDETSGGAWANFSKWLREDDGVYWINGKAGSGKSTLMKFLKEDPRTAKLLSTWANGTPLYVGSFFFWLSGTREQRSQQGLLRSLLFEILNQQPSLIPIAFPLLWAQIYTREIVQETGVTAGSWSLKSLKDAFRLLVTQRIVSLKLFLLIDGLDEFDGDHEEISDLFKNSSSGNVKICLSSRPWIVFEGCFEENPSLRMQDLTRSDIILYVQETLIDNVHFRKLMAGHPESAQVLISDIVGRADGVFLWVTLVVRSLLNGIRNKDSIADLQLRLREIPLKLEPLYAHLLSLIEPIYLAWASKAFQILREAQKPRVAAFAVWMDKQLNQKYERSLASPDVALHPKSHILSVIELYLAMDESISTHAVQDWTAEMVARKCEDTKVQLTARCAGLLETWDLGSLGPGSQVQYLHRTARDYLLKPQVWQQIISHRPTDYFNTAVSFCRTSVLQVSLSNLLSKNVEIDYDMFRLANAIKALSYASVAEDDPLKVPSSILDNLDTIMTPTSLGDDDHWSKGLNESRYLSGTSGMLQIAAVFGLTSFLAEAPVDARARLDNGASLLHNATDYDYTPTLPESRPPRLSTIELLLETCDVNLIHITHNLSPWKKVLFCLLNLIGYGYSWGRLGPFLQIISAMLKAGADTSIRVGPTDYRTRYDIQSLVQSLRRTERVDIVRVSTELTELEEEIENAYERAEKHRETPPPLLPPLLPSIATVKTVHVEVPVIHVGDESSTVISKAVPNVVVHVGSSSPGAPKVVSKESRKHRLKTWLKK